MGAHLSLFYAACARIIVNHGSASRLYLVGAADESSHQQMAFWWRKLIPFESVGGEISPLRDIYAAFFVSTRARSKAIVSALMIMTRHVSMEPKRRRRDVRNEMNTNSRMCVCLLRFVCESGNFLRRLCRSCVAESEILGCLNTLFAPLPASACLVIDLWTLNQQIHLFS